MLHVERIRFSWPNLRPGSGVPSSGSLTSPGWGYCKLWGQKDIFGKSVPGLRSLEVMVFGPTLLKLWQKKRSLSIWLAFNPLSLCICTTQPKMKSSETDRFAAYRVHPAAISWARCPRIPSLRYQQFALPRHPQQLTQCRVQRASDTLVK